MYLILFISLFLNINCGKKEDAMPVSNQQLLTTSGGWKLTAETLSPPFQGITDYYAELDPCEADNILKFLSNGTFSIDEGATKCDASDPQLYITGTWSWNSNNTLTMSYTGAKEKEQLSIITLTSTMLKFSHSSKLMAGSVATETYQAQ